jgi:hypothetical protein
MTERRTAYQWGTESPIPVGSYADADADGVPRPRALGVFVHGDDIFDLTDAEYAEYEAAKTAGGRELAEYLDDLTDRIELNVTAIEQDGTKATADEQHAACVGQLDEAYRAARALYAALTRVADAYGDVIGYDPRRDVEGELPAWLTNP